MIFVTSSFHIILFCIFLIKPTLGKPNHLQRIGYASVCSFPVILGFTISTFLGTTSSTASTASKHALTSGCCSEAFLSLLSIDGFTPLETSIGEKPKMKKTEKHMEKHMDKPTSVFCFSIFGRSGWFSDVSPRFLPQNLAGRTFWKKPFLFLSEGSRNFCGCLAW